MEAFLKLPQQNTRLDPSLSRERRRFDRPDKPDERFRTSRHIKRLYVISDIRATDDVHG